MRQNVKPTQEPVPSSDIKDLFFNSGLLDIWATSLEHKYIDRFGNCHLTAAGMEWLFKELVETFKVDMNTAIVAAGYITIDSFQQGADLPNNELTQRNHILRDETTGEYYRWDGDLPKQVPAGSTPQSTGGVGKGVWVSIGDASLRSALIKGDGSLIGVGNGNTLDTKLKSMLSAVDYGFVGDIDGDSSAKFAEMQRDAFSAGIRVIHFPQKTSFNLESDILTAGNSILIGHAEIKTTNPNNRYIKCYREADTSQENSYLNIGGLSSFASALLRARYMGDRKPKVVFIGDSLTMGSQHRNDFSGIADRLKIAIRNGINFDCDFYNRAIAGSAIGEFLGKIPAYANVSEVHGNGEEPWITDKNRTWLSYIEDIQPDLVIVGFGMNAPNANDSHFCRKVRAALKALNSNPSVMWVTTPMRTIDASRVNGGASFGTYPGNEYSNTAGLTYGGYGRWVGDTVIDANRAASLVMLGIDPASCAIKPEPSNRYRTTGNVTATINGNYINATVNALGILASQEYMRDGAVEFKADTLSGVFRVRGRSDTNSTNTIYVDISSAEIKLYAPTPNTAEMGLVSQVTIDTVGKTIRFQFVGTRVFITVDGILVIDVYDIYAAQFTSNIIMQAVSNTCVVSNVRFYKGEYKTNPPLLTPSEVFSPDFGLGGNGLNHPNTLGNEYIYGAALKDFPKLLSSAIANNALVNKTQSATLAAGVTGSITCRRIGNMIYVEGTDIDGTLPAYETITTLDILFYPQNTVSGGATSSPITGGATSFVGVRIGTNGRLVLTSPLPNGGSKINFSISYARVN